MRVCVCVCARACVRACVRAFARGRACGLEGGRVCVCVCVCGGGGVIYCLDLTCCFINTAYNLYVEVD